MVQDGTEAPLPDALVYDTSHGTGAHSPRVGSQAVEIRSILGSVIGDGDERQSTINSKR